MGRKLHFIAVCYFDLYVPATIFGLNKREQYRLMKGINILVHARYWVCITFGHGIELPMIYIKVH